MNTQNRVHALKATKDEPTNTSEISRGGLSAADAAQQNVVALSLYRFDGMRNKLWAFAQMGFARPQLARNRSCSFYKLFGTGSGEGFVPRANWGVYARLTIWPDLATARHQVATAPVMARMRKRAAESLTLYLAPYRLWGAWDGAAPFHATIERQFDKPVAVITRAKVRLSKVREFWRAVPEISLDLEQEHGPWMKRGVGEVPLIQQVTLSLWPSETEMLNFSHGRKGHGRGIELAQSGNWFYEQLFARAHILAAEGSWSNRDHRGSRAIGTDEADSIPLDQLIVT
ncbi:MAG: spheroidene monooxygenase [Pseudomonadota bacterium]